MSIRLTIYDGATPMLDRIAQLHHLSALASLDQAGFELREQTRNEFLRSKQSEWHVKIVNGRRKWYKGSPRPVFGERLNFRKAGPSNMANMINSYLMAGKLTLVVAGMHKTFRARMYYKESQNNFEGGAQFASTPTGQVLGGSWEILKKLNDGGRFSQQSKRYKGTRMGEDTKPIGTDPVYTPRHFIESGRSKAMGRVTEIMTSKLESLIYKQINRAEVRIERKVS